MDDDIILNFMRLKYIEKEWYKAPEVSSSNGAVKGLRGSVSTLNMKFVPTAAVMVSPPTLAGIPDSETFTAQAVVKDTALSQDLLSLDFTQPTNDAMKSSAADFLADFEGLSIGSGAVGASGVGVGSFMATTSRVGGFVTAQSKAVPGSASSVFADFATPASKAATVASGSAGSLFADFAKTTNKTAPGSTSTVFADFSTTTNKTTTIVPGSTSTVFSDFATTPNRTTTIAPGSTSTAFADFTMNSPPSTFRKTSIPSTSQPLFPEPPTTPHPPASIISSTLSHNKTPSPATILVSPTPTTPPTTSPVNHKSGDDDPYAALRGLDVETARMAFSSPGVCVGGEGEEDVAEDSGDPYAAFRGLTKETAMMAPGAFTYSEPRAFVEGMKRRSSVATMGPTTTIHPLTPPNESVGGGGGWATFGVALAAEKGGDEGGDEFGEFVD
ncbi:hypothetical protein HDU67_001469, partial [Dinochytrium kinnereticum]